MSSASQPPEASLDVVVLGGGGHVGLPLSLAETIPYLPPPRCFSLSEPVASPRRSLFIFGCLMRWKARRRFRR